MVTTAPQDNLTDVDVPGLTRRTGNKVSLPRNRWSLGYRKSCCRDADVYLQKARQRSCLRNNFCVVNHMLPFLCSRSFKSPLNVVSRYHQSVRLSGPNKMHRKVTIDTSPPPARWMKDTLVRGAFHRTVPVVAARLPAAKAGIILKAQPMRG